MTSRSFLSAAVLLLLAAACKVDPKIVEPLPVNSLAVTVPEGWPQPVYTFSNNTPTSAGFSLGRALFYEPMLSKDNSISCGSCHQNFAAFANDDHALSHGVADHLGVRNSPGLFNLAWHPYFMHDGGVNHIEVQPLAPITNPIEMAEDINDVMAKLQSSDKYKAMFKAAYGSEEVTTQRMFRAMAQFMGLMYSYNSKYDYYKRRENNVQLSDQELRGYSLFLAKCNNCHREPLFTDFQFRNNGLAVNKTLKDSGRAHITGLSSDLYKYKTPSLRNVLLTFPYMHDGSLKTLEDCLNHYTNSIVNTINLDPQLANGIAMTTEEKQDIIAFLKTLTDYKFIADPQFADPNENR